MKHFPLAAASSARVERAVDSAIVNSGSDVRPVTRTPSITADDDVPLNAINSAAFAQTGRVHVRSAQPDAQMRASAQPTRRFDPHNVTD